MRINNERREVKCKREQEFLKLRARKVYTAGEMRTQLQVFAEMW